MLIQAVASTSRSSSKIRKWRVRGECEFFLDFVYRESEERFSVRGTIVLQAIQDEVRPYSVTAPSALRAVQLCLQDCPRHPWWFRQTRYELDLLKPIDYVVVGNKSEVMYALDCPNTATWGLFEPRCGSLRQKQEGIECPCVLVP
jgi:hypothetical protein